MDVPGGANISNLHNLHHQGTLCLFSTIAFMGLLITTTARMHTHMLTYNIQAGNGSPDGEAQGRQNKRATAIVAGTSEWVD